MTEDNILIPKNKEEQKSIEVEDKVYAHLQAEIRCLHLKLNKKQDEVQPDDYETGMV